MLVLYECRFPSLDMIVASWAHLTGPSPPAWFAKRCSWFIFYSAWVKTSHLDVQLSTLPTTNRLAAHTSGSALILDWIAAAAGPEELSYLHYALQPFLGPVQSWLFSDGPDPLYLPPTPSGRPPWETGNHRHRPKKHIFNSPPEG